ncbi:two-component response regulator [Scytonema sp. HK-05]|uniref:response regulator n=1 Tax=Scytonema sp. HK-05 TaxID=1137095 RepID=UPI0009361430|nr:response regulator [Scytonema sp. HK-05]OKH59284.1 two-component system response regulator [Scytonema sp. HK-05]BAY46249.1 two-component response regulator [Scytonema sp. HK-05]
MSNDSENFHPEDDIDDFQPLEGLRVVVVDDDADNCNLIAFILESAGIQVMTAASAVEALQVIRQFEPNLLISDIAMPEVDGYSLIRRVRTLDPPLGAIRAIAVTAMDIQEGRDLAFMSGFEAYLMKPVEPTELITEIIKLIELP